VRGTSRRKNWPCYQTVNTFLEPGLILRCDLSSGTGTYVELSGLIWLRIGQVSGTCTRVNGPSGSIKFGQFLDKLRTCQLLKDCAQRHGPSVGTVSLDRWQCCSWQTCTGNKERWQSFWLLKVLHIRTFAQGVCWSCCRCACCSVQGGKEAAPGAALADRPLSGRCELLAQRVTTAHFAGCTETRSSTNARPAKCLMCRSSMATDVGTVLPHPPYSFELVPSL